MQDAETPDRTRKVWGEGGIRAFVSHVATYKEEAAKLKESLEERGIAAFVAHEQIDVSEEWQGEIDYALRTGHVPQVGVTVHHPYQLLAGSWQQHLLC